MAKQKHTFLKIGGAAAAAFAAWKWVYQPWRMAQDTAAGAGASLWPTGGGGGGWYGSSGGGGVSFPTYVGPAPGHSLNPADNVGGVVGACMQKKGWTQQQCVERLNEIRAAWTAGQAELAKLSSGGALSEANAALATTQAALAAAMNAYNQAMAANNPAAANQAKLAMDQYNADIAAIQSRIGQLGSRTAAYQRDLANLAANYTALTGAVLA